MTKTANVEKKTQVQMFDEIRGYLINQGAPYEFVEFLDGRISLLTAQAEKAKERKSKKEKPEDKMLAAVEAQLGEKLKTGEEITEALVEEFPEVSKAKVTARLTTLVHNGVAGKIQVAVGGGKRIMAYALAEYMPKDEDED